MKKIMLSTILLAGCGGAATGPGAGGTYGSFAVTSAADLPTCDDTTRGHLYYLETENEFQTCKTTGWTVISIQGADGNDGTNGTDGLTVASGFRCATVEAIPSFNDVEYRAVLYSNGDRWISCAITNTAGTSSNSTYYQSGTSGATQAACMLNWDFSGAATGGYWTFTEVGGVRKAVYTDSGAAADGTTVTYLSGECTNF